MSYYDPRLGDSPYLDMDDAYPGDGVFEVGSDPFSATDSAHPTAARQENQTIADVPLPLTDEERAALGQTMVRPTVQSGDTAARPQRPMSAGQGASSTLVRHVGGGSRSSLDATKGSTGYVERLQEEPARKGSGASHAGALLMSAPMVVAAWCLRAMATVLSLCVVGASLFTGAHRLDIELALGRLEVLLPQDLQGLLVRETPLGGVFHGDLALMALALFLLDWLLLRLSYGIRKREGRD